MTHIKNAQSGDFSDYALKGVAGGTAAAALAVAIREIVTARRDRKKEDSRNGAGIDANTIILTLPKKKASARDSFTDIQTDAVETEAEKDTSVPREDNGRFAPRWRLGKNAAASDSLYSDITTPGTVANRTSNILGMGGAGVLTFIALQRLHRKIEQQRLKEEISDAQKEYIEVLSGKSQKTAGAMLSKILQYDDSLIKTANPKSYAPKPFTESNKEGVSMALAGLLSMMAFSSWVTKKTLDARFGNGEGSIDESDIPKIQNIKFKYAQDGNLYSPSTIYAMSVLLKNKMQDEMIQKSAENGYIPPENVNSGIGELILSIYGSTEKRAGLLGRVARGVYQVVPKIITATRDSAIQAEIDKLRDAKRRGATLDEKGRFLLQLADENQNTPVDKWQIRNPAEYEGLASYLQSMQNAVTGNDSHLADEYNKLVRRITNNSIRTNMPNYMKWLNSDEMQKFMDDRIRSSTKSYWDGVGERNPWMKSIGLTSLLENVMSWFYRNTGWGRRSVLRKALGNYADEETVDSLITAMKTGKVPNGQKAAPVATASTSAPAAHDATAATTETASTASPIAPTAPAAPSSSVIPTPDDTTVGVKKSSASMLENMANIDILTNGTGEGGVSSTELNKKLEALLTVLGAKKKAKKKTINVTALDPQARKFIRDNRALISAIRQGVENVDVSEEE